MLLIMDTISSEDDSAQYDYAICMLEDRAAKVLAGYVALFNFMKKSQPELLEMVFKDTDVECDFYPRTIFNNNEDGVAELLPDSVEEGLDDKGWEVLPSGYMPNFGPKDAHIPAESFIIICDGGFFWRTWPQNYALEIDTSVVPVEILSKII